MATLKLSAPWVEFYRQVEAFFKYDSEVKVIYDEEEAEIKLYVDNATKADALTELLPIEKDFECGMNLKITIIPSNKDDNKVNATNSANIFVNAFDGNEALSYVQCVTGIFSNDIVYVVFKNEVVQYFNDNLGDIHGIRSTLYQDIAKNVFNAFPNVYYCTDIPNSTVTCSGVTKKLSLGKPLGEWP